MGERKPFRSAGMAALWNEVVEGARTFERDRKEKQGKFDLLKGAIEESIGLKAAAALALYCSSMLLLVILKSRMVPIPWWFFFVVATPGVMTVVFTAGNSRAIAFRRLAGGDARLLSLLRVWRSRAGVPVASFPSIRDEVERDIARLEGRRSEVSSRAFSLFVVSGFATVVSLAATFVAGVGDEIGDSGIWIVLFLVLAFCILLLVLSIVAAPLWGIGDALFSTCSLPRLRMLSDALFIASVYDVEWSQSGEDDLAV